MLMSSEDRRGETLAISMKRNIWGRKSSLPPAIPGDLANHLG
jgi:hypothetical protein